MKSSRKSLAVFAATAIVPAICVAGNAWAQAGAGSAKTPIINSGNATVTQHAKGDFDVKIGPLEAYNRNEGADAGRMSIDKQFHGDLDAVSKGEMLTAGTPVKGSAGYVAIERVTGKLGGKSGSFALQHSATMNRGTPQLSITVVPDSGTGELAGITGRMNIIIAGGKHSYEFDYTIVAP